MITEDKEIPKIYKMCNNIRMTCIQNATESIRKSLRIYVMHNDNMTSQLWLMDIIKGNEWKTARGID